LEKKYMLKRQLYYLFPPNIRLLARRIYFFPSDLKDIITGKRDRILPPRGMIFIGPGDFKKIGESYLRRFIELAGLKPEHRILDVGCGIGRIAIPLTRYLNSKGSYEGFDIVEKGINWCKKHISKNYPNFNFLHIDLKNDLYNLKTNQEAKNFIFPYKDNEFDLAVLTSVFTHMMPDDVSHYLHQIHRVLKPGGKCFVTFFVLNDESTHYMNCSEALNFKYNFGVYSLIDNNVKEANVAYDEKYLHEVIRKNELKIDTIFYGYWSGRPKEQSLDFQDTFVLSKN
jgi:ubiquinone/menaquinone biosynthesis C-methylase UbiE